MDQRMKPLTDSPSIPSEGRLRGVVYERDDVRGVDSDDSLGGGLQNDLVLLARRFQQFRSFLDQVLELPLPAAQGCHAENVEERKQRHNQDDHDRRKPDRLIEMWLLLDAASSSAAAPSAAIHARHHQKPIATRRQTRVLSDAT